ncbi:hypothetical protein [Paludisphaera borealis]|nr:hypothetical protein [Paludisphaera borealis]
MSNLRMVKEHHGDESLQARIDEALRRAGLGVGVIGWEDLAPSRNLVGSLKAFRYEDESIVPFVANSPVMNLGP